MEEESYSISCFARGLDKKDGFFKKSDPFLKFIKRKAQEEKLIHKTEAVYQSLNPTWDPFTIRKADLDSETEILDIECWDWDADGSHDFIGRVKASISDLKKKTQFNFENPARQGMFTKSSVSGQLFINSCKDVLTRVHRPFAYEFQFAAVHLFNLDGIGGKSGKFVEVMGILLHLTFSF
jgi:Ca2+-dependent lipid-binding protein